MLGLILRLAASALAVWLSTLLPGVDIDVTAESTGGKIGTVVLIAIIFGLINAVIKPVVKTIGCAAYVLTLGLIALVVNGLLLMLTSWIAGKLDIPFKVQDFWPDAVVGALFIGIVTWVLSLVIPDKRSKPKKVVVYRPQPPPPPPPPRYPPEQPPYPPQQGYPPQQPPYPPQSGPGDWRTGGR